MKTRLLIITTMLCVCFTSCDLIGKGKGNTSTEPSEPSSAEKEKLEKKKIKGNIAKYVILDINKENGEISIKNNTEYTLERVDISIAWTQFNINDGTVALSDTRSFSYISANSVSTKIPFDKYDMKDIYGQITSIECSSLDK